MAHMSKSAAVFASPGTSRIRSAAHPILAIGHLSDAGHNMTSLTARRVFFVNLLLASLSLVAAVSCSGRTPQRADDTGKSARPVAPTPGTDGTIRTTAVDPVEELRGLFVITAHNTDWPSQQG